MAYINFCGHTGKCFRGRNAENTEWRKCDQPERPADVPAAETEDTWLGCLRCPMRLEGCREHNDEPYYLVRMGAGKRCVLRGWPVAGGDLPLKQLLRNRKEAGKHLRLERAAGLCAKTKAEMAAECAEEKDLDKSG